MSYLLGAVVAALALWVAFRIRWEYDFDKTEESKG